MRLIGGARLDMMNFTWPFAQLYVEKGLLILTVNFLFWRKEYSFLKGDNILIEPFYSLPIIGRGIKIHHQIKGYPHEVIFWVFDDPEKVAAKIKEIIRSD